MRFTYFFLCFIAVMFVHRLCETFSKRKKERGKIFKRWTLYCLQMVHVLIIAGVVFEYFYLKPKTNIYDLYAKTGRLKRDQEKIKNQRLENIFPP